MSSRRQGQYGRYNEDNDQYNQNNRYGNSGSYSNNNAAGNRGQRSREDQDDYYEERRPSSSNRDYDYNRPSGSSRNNNADNYGRGSSYDYYERRPSGQSRDYDDYGSSARYSSRGDRYGNTGYGEGRPSYSNDREEYYVNRTVRGRDFDDYDNYSNYRQGGRSGNYGGYSDAGRQQGYSQGYGGRGYIDDGYGTSRSDRYEEYGTTAQSGRGAQNQRESNNYTDYPEIDRQSQVNSSTDEISAGSGNDENIIASFPSSAGSTRGRKRRAATTDTNTELQDVSGDDTQGS